MKALWVDTDFGFDDLWALLLLRHLGVSVAGISLVAGNAPLAQVVSNACGARQAYGFHAPIYAGADRPLVRQAETAQRILGPRGMLSRGQHLPSGSDLSGDMDANTAMQNWLGSAQPGDRRDVLAIGPLTNMAQLVQKAPKLAQNITRLIWMGGSDGPGNHSPQAEFNALADPQAAAIVGKAGLPLDVIDLMVCRTVQFGPEHLPRSDSLTADLLGGYLDIGLSRGRPAMSIYDPLAALAAHQPDTLKYQHCTMTVSTTTDASYGKTTFTQDANSSTRLAVEAPTDAAQTCLDALSGDQAYVD